MQLFCLLVGRCEAHDRYYYLTLSHAIFTRALWPVRELRANIYQMTVVSDVESLVTSLYWW